MEDTVKMVNCPNCGAPISAEAPQGLCPKCVLIGAATETDTSIPTTATSEIPSLERVAAAFPQLEIIELVGRGGMGFVYKARQPHLERFVALKLLPDKLAEDPRFAERFNREGRVLARLNHPNIVSVYDFGTTGQFYFLIMEFVDGVNLRQAMRAGRFSPGEALTIVPRICEALQYAHEQGILHRDIKPENILLDARGHVKIADFGIAKLMGEEKREVTLTGTGATLGTPHYMAPEQLEKPSEVDHRADIYSLGVVFYEMLTGELPIGRFAAPSSKTPVGANVDEVVFRTLEKDRELRFQSAGEIKKEVEHITETGINGATDTVARPTWSRRGILKSMLLGLLPVSIGIGLVTAAIRSGKFHSSTRKAGNEIPQVIQMDPMIQFTFISAEVREENGARWFSMDYIQQVRGDAERAFPWDSKIPGWICEVRLSDSMTDGNAEFPPVRYQRVSWKLPDALDSTAAEAFRGDVAKQWLGKTVQIEGGEERTLFVLSLPNDGGTLTARVAVHVPEKP